YGHSLVLDIGFTLRVEFCRYKAFTPYRDRLFTPVRHRSAARTLGILNDKGRIARILELVRILHYITLAYRSEIVLQRSKLHSGQRTFRLRLRDSGSVLRRGSGHTRAFALQFSDAAFKLGDPLFRILVPARHHHH